MTLSDGEAPDVLGNVDYLFKAIVPSSILTQSDNAY